MAIRDELIEELLKEYKNPKDLVGKDGIIKELTSRLIEKAMEGELTHQLGYSKHSPQGNNTGNSRNGKSSKTLKGELGEIPIKVPRDRNGEFDPQIIKKHQTRFDGFDEKILSLYSRGMTTRDIQAHLKELYGVEVSPDLISTVTDSVIQEVTEWQSRPLAAVYPILYLDATIVKVRTEGRVINKSAYLAVGITLGWHQRCSGHLAGADGGGKVLVEGDDRVKEPGSAGYFYRLRGWLKRIP